jgi:TolA-binding protein
MKSIILLLLVVSITKPVFAQVPSRQEMQNQMAQVTKELNQQITELEKQIADQEKLITDAKKNKEDPDTIKSIEEDLNQSKQQLAMLKKQVEMMGGVTKGLSKMSDKTIQQASTDETSEIPKRDVTRINSLPKKVVNDAELLAFMKQTTKEVENRLPSEGKKLGIQLYDSLIARKYSAQAMGQYAFACMASGYPEMGLYLYGKACLADMTNADNLNNYAAYLTMAGGEQYSIPILDNLNSKYQYNSTVLNNLGQAWFGLGDMNKAKKNLEDAVKIYSIHSRANETLCIIQQSEGQTQQATESLQRSLQGAFSDEKKSRLEKLGTQNVCNQAGAKYPHPIDPLGVAKFLHTVPAIPLNIGEAETLHEQWIPFRERIQMAIEKLSPQIANLEQREKEWSNKLLDPSQNKLLLRPFANPVYYTANCKFLSWMVSEEAAMKNLAKHYSNAILKTNELTSAYYSKVGQVKTCAARNALLDELLSNANQIWQDYKVEFLAAKKRYFDEALIHQLYSRPIPQDLWEMELTKAKIDLLSELGGIKFVDMLPCIDNEKKEEEKKHGELPDFDELHCNYKTDIWIPGWRYTIECNKMTTECDLVIIRGSMEENLNTGNIIKGHADIGVSKSLGTKSLGPIAAEVKVESGLFIEWGNSGVTDFGASAGVKSELGFTTPHQMEEMITIHTESAGKIAFGSYPAVDMLSAEVKIGVTSGFHSEMKGLLMGHH